MASLRNITLVRWFLSYYVAILLGLGGLCSVVVGLREPMPGQYTGPWTNEKLINHRWPVHIVPVPRAKADELADYLTLFEWRRTELFARGAVVLVLSLAAFTAMGRRRPTPAI